jgi:hypothetical protein
LSLISLISLLSFFSLFSSHSLSLSPTFFWTKHFFLLFLFFALRNTFTHSGNFICMTIFDFNSNSIQTFSKEKKRS